MFRIICTDRFWVFIVFSYFCRESLYICNSTLVHGILRLSSTFKILLNTRIGCDWSKKFCFYKLCGRSVSFSPSSSYWIFAGRQRRSRRCFTRRNGSKWDRFGTIIDPSKLSAAPVCTKYTYTHETVNRIIDFAGERQPSPRISMAVLPSWHIHI